MMAKAPTVQDFFNKFSTDEACLERLMMLRFGNPMYCPKCGAEGRFAKLKKLPAYACPTCGHHIHPMVGTPFERSRTPLQKWFYAMYLFTTSRHGVPAKELQRQLGVTYKTAWRMGHALRKYMASVDGDPPLGAGMSKPTRPTSADAAGGRNPLGTPARQQPGRTPEAVMTRFVSLLVVLAVAGCAAFEGERITGAWKGRHIDDLILNWGPPAAFYEAADGRRTATFGHSRAIAGTQYYCNATFGTDARGIITTAQVDGNLGGCNVFFANKRAP